MSEPSINRRTFGMLAAAGALSLAVRPARAAAPEFLTKPIPASGERISAIGMGTSRTFNVGNDARLRDARTDVLKRFFAMGGEMIDSSPMYGSSEAVIGYGLEQLAQPEAMFSATKVWTSSTEEGLAQFQESLDLWKQKRLDLYQVHNLVNWEDHLAKLREYKQDGAIRYIGITTSHGWRHEPFLEIMATEDLDFVQFSYNIDNREAENRLLPLAADKGIAVIINRPFQRGQLMDRYEGEKLPGFASEVGIENWAQYLLKFVISHPAVTVAIPATRQVEHMTENMGALKGPVPDAAMRQRMIDYVESL